MYKIFRNENDIERRLPYKTPQLKTKMKERTVTVHGIYWYLLQREINVQRRSEIMDRSATGIVRNGDTRALLVVLNKRSP
jgi:hypothetical protein